jgi:ABC-2 type transport system permease protein
LGENQFEQGKIVPLGYDKWTNTNYGNKAFLTAAMDYLLGKAYLLQLKSKIKRLVVIQQENLEERSNGFFYWSFLLPSVLFSMSIVLLHWRRRKRYASL